MPDTNTISMITSIFLLASWLGCMIISIFGMKLGRRQWIIYGCLVQVVGTIISATSYSSGQMIAGRTLIVRGPSLNSIPNYANLHPGCWQWFPDVDDSHLCCRDGCRCQQARTGSQHDDCSCQSRHSSSILGVSLPTYFVLRFSDFFSDFGMVFASSQAVWRFPVAFQVVWAFATIAVFYPLPGKSDLFVMQT